MEKKKPKNYGFDWFLGFVMGVLVVLCIIIHRSGLL